MPAFSVQYLWRMNFYFFSHPKNTAYSDKNEETSTKGNYLGRFAEMKAQLTGDVSTALGEITNLWDSPVFDYSRPVKTTRTVPLNIQELEYYNYFSASIYCPTSLANLTCPYCDHFNQTVTEFKIFYNENYGTKAMITLHPGLDEIVVTFRGTVSMVNWILDYQMYGTPLGREGVEVHTGLYLSLMSLYNPVVQEVGTLLGRNPGFRVVVTGHSLGAAMASIFVYLMTSLDQFPGTNYVLVTFGQPRTGNVEYADYMNALPIPMIRVVGASEGVPHIPPHKAFEIFYIPTKIVYVHHGQEVWLNENEVYYCSKDVYEDPYCSNSIGRNFNKLDHLFYFDADYSICLFIEGWLNVDFFTVPGFTPTNFIPPVPTWAAVRPSGPYGLETVIQLNPPLSRHWLSENPLRNPHIKL
ncbi:Lipase [Folsomia candida]|uniref:Lipase n=1 Tax=Folsomia candida TaxID=158441 RepID=A0A226DXV8_FOLCA|nr:Lipase [Folsomia candida]